MDKPFPILGQIVDLPLETAAPGLSGFDLKFATFTRHNPVTVHLEIHEGEPSDSRPPKVTGAIDAGGLDDFGWVRFRIAPAEPLPAGRLTLRFASPEATDTCCVAVFPQIDALTYEPLQEDDGSPTLMAKGGLAARCLLRDGARAGLQPAVLKYWLDCYGVYVEGHLHSVRAAVEKMAVGVRGETPTDLSLEPMEDEEPGFKYRFAGYADCPAGVPLLVTVTTTAGVEVLPLLLPRLVRPEPKKYDLFERFVHAINGRPGNPTVVEIGARHRGAMSLTCRSLFAPHVRYIGMDIYPDDNTDIVGDAHALSSLIEPGSADGVFSLAVLEHLALPWRVALEINKVMKVGGIVFHNTHQTWPLHELPNDFWRFSDEALKHLYGPETGFRVDGVAMYHEVNCYSTARDPAYLNFPFCSSFGLVEILSTKERDIDPARMHWEIDVQATHQLSQQYPAFMDTE